MEKISIIVPVYNVKPYLSKCIESILDQSYEAWELILVDDGSTDGSGDICDYYQNIDVRVKTLHKENGGVSDARNTGLAASTGPYISFIDPDDTVDKDYLKDLLELLKKQRADMAVCLGKKIYSYDEIVREKISNEKTRVYTSEEALYSVLYNKDLNLYAWGKLYKAKLFQDIRFPKGEIFEDVKTLYKVYDLADKIVFNPVCRYFYLQRPGSIVNSSFQSKKVLQIEASQEILRFIEKNYPALIPGGISRCFVSAVDIYRRIPAGEEYRNEKQYAESIIKKYRKRVLTDSNNKPLTRGIAMVSFIHVKLLRVLGDIYRMLCEKEILKLKRPI